MRRRSFLAMLGLAPVATTAPMPALAAAPLDMSGYVIGQARMTAPIQVVLDETHVQRSLDTFKRVHAAVFDYADRIEAARNATYQDGAGI